MSELPEDLPEAAIVDPIAIGDLRFLPQYNPHDFEVEGYATAAVNVDHLGETQFSLEYDPGQDALEQVKAAITTFVERAAQLFDAAREPAFAYYERVRSQTEPPPPIVESPDDVWNHVVWWPDAVKVEVDFEHSTGAHVIVHGSCTWDEEHGIELVFQSGETLTRVGDRVGNPVPLPAGDS